MKTHPTGNSKLYTIVFAMAVVIAILLSSCSDEQFNPDLTREFNIQSQANGATYIIKVALPADYDLSDKKYATVYVLDGEENFDFVANKCREISERQSVQNALVVSISYGNDRGLDYTPTKVTSSTGGCPRFFQFIKEELIPRIEEDFKAGTDRESRVILGHSYGGLFGAYAFAINNDVFGNYLLLSPSLWFDNEVVLIDEQQSREANKDKRQVVFLGIGELENSGRMQAPFEALYQVLRNNYTNIELSKNREPRLDHVGSKNPNIIKALEFYFGNR